MARFDGKVALVTGADGGIGLATAIRLGQEGARVALVARDAEKLARAAEQVRAAGAPDTLIAVCDVADESAVAALFERVVERFGSVDVLVNNAGVMSTEPLVELTARDWRRVLDVDLMGTVHCSKQALLRMGAGGAIVNVSSIHALATAPGIGPYAAVKAAMVSLTRTAALEGRERGVRANVVLPGAIDTPFLKQNPNYESGVQKIEPHELGTPEDVAAAIVFLASDDARFIQGASLVVDGGRTAKL